MATYGVTDSGFVLKRFNTVLAEMKDDIRSNFPEAILSDETIGGQFASLSADRIADLWEALEAVFNAAYPHTASNVSLNNVLALNNMERLAATKTILPSVEITGVATTIIPANFKASSSLVADLVFQVSSASVIPASGKLYIDFFCTATGPKVLEIGQLDTIDTPTTDVTAITNGNATEVGRNVETDVEFRVRRDNEIANALGGSEKGIYNAISKLNEDETERLITYINIISNRTASVDAAGRLPKSFELVVSDEASYTTIATPGGGPTGLIATATVLHVLSTDVTDVVSIGDTISIIPDSTNVREKATVINIEFTTFTIITLNAPLSLSTDLCTIETVSGKDAEIAQALFDSATAGVDMNGLNQINVTDNQGKAHVVSFNHPIEVPIYLKLQLIVTSSLTTEEQLDLKEKIVTWGQTLGIAQTVVVYGYNCLVGQLDNSKITDVTLAIDTTGPASGLTIGVGSDDNIIISDGTTTRVELSTWSVDDIFLV